MRTDYLICSISLALLSISTAVGATPVTQPGSVRLASAAHIPQSLYIVQAATMSASERSVARVNATVERDFEVIHAVSAYLTPAQASRLRGTSGVHIFQDRVLSTRGLGSLLKSITKSVVSTVGAVAAPVVTVATPVVTPVARIVAPVTNPVLRLVTPLAAPVLTPLTSAVIESISVNMALEDGTGVGSSSLLYETDYPALVGADLLQQGGITGRGVTIAVLDSGLWQDPSQSFGPRVLASIDVVNGGSSPVTGDAYGHGTHVTSIAAGGRAKYLAALLRHRAAGQPRHRSGVRWYRRRPLHRRHSRIKLGRREPAEIQHPRSELVVRGATAVVLLGRSGQPGRHGCMASRHCRRGRGGQ